MELTDYHTHTPLCKHAEGWPVELAARARELGLGELGLADHNPFREPLDDWRMDWEDLPRYFDSVAEAAATFPVKLGMECDFLPGRESDIDALRETAAFDYLIGSVHYIASDWDVDNPKWVGRIAEFGVEETWRLYQKRYLEAIRSGLFDFMAHPDLPKKFDDQLKGDTRWFYEPIVEALASAGVAYEINTAGWDKPCREAYPFPDFIRAAFEARVPVVINSDAHAPGEVGRHFGKALALAREAGYRETVRWNQGVRSAVPLPP